MTDLNAKKPNYVAIVITVASVAAAVILGGFWLSLLLTLSGLMLLITIHEAAHLLAALGTGIGAHEFSVGMGPKVFGFSRRGIDWNLRALPIGGFVKVNGMEDRDEGKGYYAASIPRRLAVVAAGPVSNVVVAAILIAGVLTSAGSPTGNMEVTAVTDDAAVAGVVSDGDILVSVDGVSAYEFVTTDISEAVLADGQATLQFMSEGVERREVVFSDNGRLGVYTATERGGFDPAWVVGATGEALGDMFSSAGMALKMIPEAVAGIPQQFFGDEEPSDVRFVSPIGIANIGQQVSSETGDWRASVFLLAQVSLFLGVFNALPLPPLDGGHALMAAAEGASRRLGITWRSPDRFIRAVTYAVVALLLSVGVAALMRDLLDVLAGSNTL